MGPDRLYRNVGNYHSTERNNAKQRRSQTQRCSSAVLCHMRPNYRVMSPQIQRKTSSMIRYKVY